MSTAAPGAMLNAGAEEQAEKQRGHDGPHETHRQAVIPLQAVLYLAYTMCGWRAHCILTDLLAVAGFACLQCRDSGCKACWSWCRPLQCSRRCHRWLSGAFCCGRLCAAHWHVCILHGGHGRILVLGWSPYGGTRHLRACRQAPQQEGSSCSRWLGSFHEQDGPAAW